MNHDLSMISTVASAREMLSAVAADRIVAFLQSAQTVEGGFCDRAGRPDLYYTVFGLSGLVALRKRVPHRKEALAFLDGCRLGPARSFVDLVSLVRCACLVGLAGRTEAADPARLQPVLEQLQRYRSRDGGYSHERPHAETGTLYAAFLAEQAGRDAGVELEGIPAPVARIETFRTPDGAYSNHAGTRHGTASVTAAAAILLARRGQSSVAQAALAALEAMRWPSGGYGAAAAAPAPDLLSTATALYACRRCGRSVSHRVRAATAAFVEGLWSDEGGFRGSDADAAPDVEYTFYGLLALGALVALRKKEEHVV